MRKSIGQELYLYRSNMGILAAVSAVSWLAGILGMMVFQQLTKSGEALFPIGTVMLLWVGVIFSLFVLANIVPHNFDLAVSMGKTRKHYLPAAVCVIFLETLVIYVLAALGFRAERELYRALYHGRELKGNLGPFLTPAWILCYAIFETGCICLYGGMLKKNRKVGAICWIIVWITVCWSSGGFWGEYEEAEHSLMNSFAFWGYQLRLWYTGFPLGTRMAILVVCGLAGCCIMYLMLRKEAAD